jgi:hypothetical protein
VLFRSPGEHNQVDAALGTVVAMTSAFCDLGWEGSSTTRRSGVCGLKGE